jgi:hypothetical protein
MTKHHESRKRRSRVAKPLPSFAGQGLQPGVDLDDSAKLLDLMEAGAIR